MYACLNKFLPFDDNTSRSMAGFWSDTKLGVHWPLAATWFLEVSMCVRVRMHACMHACILVTRWRVCVL